MLIGLAQVIRTRRTDLDHPPRWNYTTLVDVDRSEPRVYKVSYLTAPDNGEQVEYLSTSQMSIAELRSLREFVANGRTSDVPQFPPTVEEPEEPEELEEPEEREVEMESEPEAKPKASGTTRLTGLEMLERKCRAVEPPISEAIRGTAISASEPKYRTVRVVKTYTVTREEVFHVRFTDKTLEEFRDMGNGDVDDRMVFNYLLRRQTNKLSPVEVRDTATEKPTFEIKEK